MKVVAIIQARMGSTRLPGKVMMEIAGKTVLEHVITRVKQAKLIDEIVIATTTQLDDNVIVEEAKRLDVRYFRGSEDDVLERYYYAAKENKADIVVRITSDCPLIDSIIIDEIIECYKKSNYKILSNAGSDLTQRTYPRGLDVEVFSFSALEGAFVKADQRHQREHVTPYIYENTQEICYYKNAENYSRHRWTLDTQEDFRLINRIYDELYKGKHNFNFKDIIELFEYKPELFDINSHIEQKKLYMPKNILFCGFGKLGVECLKKLLNENYNVLGILTHKEEQDNSVDTFAKQHNIKFSYNDTRKETTFLLNLLNGRELDYIISINYKYILPKEVFSLAKNAINIHGSLLPKYRGRTPHVWSIINGERYSGVTCHLIEEGVDTGNIVEQVVVEIEDNDTGYSLLEKFQGIYPDILINSLNKLQKETGTIEQDEEEASYYGKRTPDMGYIDFYKGKNEIINFVRAQAYPYPGAYYYLPNGKKIIINSLEPEKKGEISINEKGVIRLIDNSYYVKCTDGVLKLLNFKIST